MTEDNMKHQVEHKSVELEIKADGDTGGLTGYLSTFGNIDQGGDIVEAGAFTKTLQERPVNALLWHHDPSEPAKVCGSYSAKQDDRGLLIDSDFLPDPDSQNIRTKVRALKERGVKVGLSIGYQVVKFSIDKVGGEVVRRLKELKLNEGSLTLFPMNEMALVTGVKSEGDDEMPPMQYCEHCIEALFEEPAKATPAAEPPTIKSEPVIDHSLKTYAEVVREIRESIERGTNA
jgi:hypothetical protein